ncbi:MAG: Gfo/Idh/MocA family protein [Prolixibacteraceae bacterium]
MKPKFGIIGCGNISRFHFNGLEKAGAEIVHVADINEAAAKPYAEKFGAKLSTSYKEVIHNPEVTAVSVLTSGKYHHQICIEALEAGKDVVCEKTLADNPVEAYDIVKAAEKSGKLFFVAYMKRFFPAYKKAAELLPKLGHLFSVQVRSFQPWGNFYEREELGDWDFVFTNYGGAILKCAGSHMLDAFLGLLGRPSRVYAHIDYFKETLFDRKAIALFEYPQGLVVNFEAASHPLSKIGYEKNSWDEFIEINGTNGRLKLSTVMWDAPENNPALLEYYDNEAETVTEFRFDKINPFDIEMQEIVNCLEAGKQISPDVIDGFNVDVLIDAMKFSHDNKKSIEIDWKGI